MATTDGMTPVFAFSSSAPPLNRFVPGPDTRQPDAMNGQSVVYYPYHVPVAKTYGWSLGIQHELTHGFVAEASYIGNTTTHLLNQRDLNQVPENLLGPGNAQSRRPYPQYQAVNSYIYDGYSNYNGFQAVLRRAFAQGFSFDINYTWSKNLVSQDASGWNGQAGAQNWQRAYAPDTNYGLSNNDIPNMFKGSAVYQWPIGKGKRFLNRGGLLNTLIGG